MDEHELDGGDLAGKLNLAPSTISNWIHGKTLPNYHQIKALSEVFDVSADSILDTKYDD